MKVWINTSFSGHYPVGTSAVIIAPTAEEACRLLNDALMEIGLKGLTHPNQFTQIKTNEPRAIILQDGDY